MIDRSFDIHTHNPSPSHQAVISVEPGALMDSGKYYSVGIHPWNTENFSEETLVRLRSDVLAPNVVAIGETGLDKSRGAGLDVQELVFLEHVSLSEQTRKPLILHVVKAYQEIIKIKERLKPTQPWIIHGFRGKPELAKELLRHGFEFSVGEKFNPDSLKLIPQDKLWMETDVSEISFSEIKRAVKEIFLAKNGK